MLSIQKADRFRSAPYLAAKVPILQLSILRSADFNQSKPDAKAGVAKQVNHKGQVLFGKLAGRRTRHMQLSVFVPDFVQPDPQRWGRLGIIFVA